MKKVTKAEAFKALESILDNAMVNQCQHAEDIITVVRFIEQQWESEAIENEDLTKSFADYVRARKPEGTI